MIGIDLFENDILAVLVTVSPGILPYDGFRSLDQFSILKLETGFKDTSSTASQGIGAEIRNDPCDLVHQIPLVCAHSNVISDCTPDAHSLYGGVPSEFVVIGKREGTEEINEVFRPLDEEVEWLAHECDCHASKPKIHLRVLDRDTKCGAATGVVSHDVV